MRHTTTTTTPARSLVLLARETVSDFVLGVLAPLAVPALVLGGLVALFVGPLVLLARSCGAL